MYIYIYDAFSWKHHIAHPLLFEILNCGKAKIIRQYFNPALSSILKWIYIGTNIGSANVYTKYCKDIVGKQVE